MLSPFDAIREYVDMGLAAFPLLPKSKRPAIESWEPFKSRLPTHDEIDRWEKALPADCNVALVCGTVSGLAVLDADTADAIDYIKEAGMTTGLQVRTSRGMHYYHRLSEPTPKVPKFNGRFDIQLQADKSYVAAPPSVHESGHAYEWSHPGVSLEDALELIPEWKAPDLSVEDDFDFAKLDLSGHSIGSALQEIEDRVERHGKLKDGDGRNSILTRYVGELVASRITEEDVRARIDQFQERYFADYLPSDEVSATVHSIFERDRKAHPDRYDPNTGEVLISRKPNEGITLYTADEIMVMPYTDIDYLAEPAIQKPGICMVYGASGAGKSVFTGLLTWHMANGRDFGPFHIKKKSRILYIDAEQGGRTIIGRMRDFNASYGRAGGEFGVLSESLQSDPNAILNVDPRDEAGRLCILRFMGAYKPDVVVMDNIRTMASGMEENDAGAWSKINDFARRLRNLGVAVIVVHHSNKARADQSGVLVPGTYAGNTNAVTVCDTVIRVQQVKAGTLKIKDASAEADAFEWLERKIPRGGCIHHAMWIEYDKARDHDPALYLPHLVGVMQKRDGTHEIVSSLSNKQKARFYYYEKKFTDKGDPFTTELISSRLTVPEFKIKQWLGL